MVMICGHDLWSWLWSQIVVPDCGLRLWPRGHGVPEDSYQGKTWTQGGSYKRDSSNREPRETWDSQVFQTVRGMLEEREESYSRGLPFQFENHDLEKALSKDKPLNHDS